jgi:ribose transport system ATP-binding protein
MAVGDLGMTEEREHPAVRLVNVSKRYGTFLAVDAINLALFPGEIVGLVGKNGAGKSTVIRILAGAVRPDNGQIVVGGHGVSFRKPHDATRVGLSFVHQELSLVPNISVAENIFLGLGYPRRFGLMDRKRLAVQAALLLSRLEADVDPMAEVNGLSIATKRLIMVARGLAVNARLLVLDEPTAALSQHEIEHLHGVVRSLAHEGVAILYVSHRVDEILALTQRVEIMRDGVVVESKAVAELDRQSLVAAISGESRQAGEGRDNKDFQTLNWSEQAERSEVKARSEILRVAHVARAPAVRDASLVVRAGEIVGIGGLVGSGRTELVRLLFGCERPDHGDIALLGRALKFRSPASAMKAGIVLVPEDRIREGSVSEYGISWNIALPNLRKMRRLWRHLPVPSLKKEREVSSQLSRKLQIASRNTSQPMNTLSGGNQQKVIIGKWLLHGARVFIFDEPTAGIDVGAKREIFEVIRSLVKGGEACAIVISSEFRELADHCDRVVVMREGRTVAELEGEDVSEAAILQHCYGAEVPAGERTI